MKHSFEAHASELERARELADRIGERLERMHAMRNDATPAQADRLAAIDAQLLPLERHADMAIQAFNDRHGTASLHGEAYQAPVRAPLRSCQGLGPSFRRRPGCGGLSARLAP